MGRNLSRRGVWGCVFTRLYHLYLSPASIYPLSSAPQWTSCCLSYTGKTRHWLDQMTAFPLTTYASTVQSRKYTLSTITSAFVSTPSPLIVFVSNCSRNHYQIQPDKHPLLPPVACFYWCVCVYNFSCIPCLWHV